MNLLFLLACPLAGAPDGPPLSCRQVAQRDDQGQLDACDLGACETCVGACGEDCRVEGDHPPRYTCPGTSWDALDVCPDWLLPEGPRVDERPVPTCGKDPGERLVARPDGPGRIAVTHLDLATGCCPDSMAVDVAYGAGVLDLRYVLFGDVCDCACELDASYEIVGVPGGRWTIVAGPSGASAEVVVD